ncbi:MAG: aminotransferase class I/II-fold pyridoxal phosphate-dependent enzyme [Candidatus Thermoplasmatota archaeon]|jgi:aspartate/methionine/tyrosine aminotransferase|nr:aminotransferase class I/II-fold pyridoxal phosphate-dependent enzyme [Candidatus Thermoplasmatota archaeon]MCL5790015.1 aminotransferase class I/II-fold pyridoxal phosphate-dependent enzyme [Candidatus Thermoplasmatota archaeon]
MPDPVYIKDLKGSPSLEVVNLVLQKLARGEKITSLAIGEPMYKTPEKIMKVAYDSMLNGETHYTSSYGTKEVREAIVEKVNRKNRIGASFENTIFITSKQSIYAVMMAIAGGRSKVLIPDPGYFYTEPILLSGLIPVRYRLNSDLSFKVENIISLLDKDTAAVLINSPGNPTGRIIGRREMERLYRECSSRGITIISDEAYEDITYGMDHFSIGSLEDSPETVVTIFSLSKSYSMTGWRAGYTIGSEEIISNVARVIENTFTCSPPFIQKASAFALLNGEEFIKEFRDDFRKKKELVEKRLSEVDGMKTFPIEGAFYAFPSYGIKMKSVELARALLDKHQVAVLPGVAFGDSGEGHIRISFAGSVESINTGIDALDRFLHQKP